VDKKVETGNDVVLPPWILGRPVICAPAWGSDKALEEPVAGTSGEAIARCHWLLVPGSSSVFGILRGRCAGCWETDPLKISRDMNLWSYKPRPHHQDLSSRNTAIATTNIR